MTNLSYVGKYQTMQESVKEEKKEEKKEVKKEEKKEDNPKKSMAPSTHTTYTDTERIHAAIESKETQCDFYFCAPKFCQAFRKKQIMLMWLCWCSFTQSFLTGSMKAVLTSLERRYGLTSKESGALIAFYDAGVLTVLVPLSYYGGKMRRLRVFSLGMFLMGMGAYGLSLPYFTCGNYAYTTSLEPACYRYQNVSHDGCKQKGGDTSLRNYRFVFWFAAVLIGIGASPLFTLCTAYIDENTSARESPTYLGIYYSFSILGPAAGFVGTSIFLQKIFVDPKSDHPSITNKDKAIWIGAWWIAFLIAGTMSVIAVPALFAFPKEMPGTAQIRSHRKSEAFGGSEAVGRTLSFQAQYFLDNAMLLIRNPTFMFICLAGTCKGVLISGVSAFGPKYMEVGFGYQAGVAAKTFGLILVPMGAGGMVLGGILVNTLNMRITTILRFQTLTSLLIIPMWVLMFIFPCGNVGGQRGWAGLTAPYHTDLKDGPLHLTSSCNQGCHCMRNHLYFSPLCGSDGLTYFSPCFAGCPSRKSKLDPYSNCTCIRKPFQNETHHYRNDTIPKKGVCKDKCPNTIMFIIGFSGFVFITFFIAMPTLSTLLRCVPEREKNFALGIKWIMVRLGGSIPGPILIGSAFDATCSIWSETCSGKGSCYLYESRSLRHRLLLICVVPQTLVTVCMAIAWFTYTPPKRQPSLDADDTFFDAHDNTLQERQLSKSDSMSLMYDAGRI